MARRKLVQPAVAKIACQTSGHERKNAPGSKEICSGVQSTSRSHPMSKALCLQPKSMSNRFGLRCFCACVAHALWGGLWRCRSRTLLQPQTATGEHVNKFMARRHAGGKGRAIFAVWVWPWSCFTFITIRIGTGRGCVIFRRPLHA